MPRGGHHGRNSVGGNNSVQLAVKSLLSRADTSYRKGVKDNHMLAAVLAENLQKKATTEQVMMNCCSDENEIQEFLQEQRQRLIKVAERNVQAMANVDAFCYSLQKIEQANGSSQDEEQENIDYTRSIQDDMKAYHNSRKNEKLEMKHEKFYRDICTRLGETLGDENEDEDLQVLPSQAPQQSLKCPITGMLFKDPVRNKTCGHTYDREGIMQTIRLHKACPVTGCANSRVTQDQLEPDEEMKLKVRQQLKRDEAAKRLQRSQAMMDDDDDAL